MIVVLFFLVILSGCKDLEVVKTTSNFSQKIDLPEVIDSLLYLDQQRGLVLYDKKPFTGLSIKRNAAGKKIASIEYLAGKKHGLYQKWFNKEGLSFRSQYLYGKREGLTESWWKNGNLRSATNYKNGLAEGTQWKWYKSGAKFKKQQLVAGREQGLQQSWRENGNIYNNYEAKNGRIFGLKRATLCYELDDEIIQYKEENQTIDASQ